MSGITFIIDEKGARTAAVIDLRRHGELWEDFYDALLVKERASDPRETLDAVKRRLKLRRKRDG